MPEISELAAALDRLSALALLLRVNVRQHQALLALLLRVNVRQHQALAAQSRQIIARSRETMAAITILIEQHKRSVRLPPEEPLDEPVHILEGYRLAERWCAEGKTPGEALALIGVPQGPPSPHWTDFVNAVAALSRRMWAASAATEEPRVGGEIQPGASLQWPASVRARGHAQPWGIGGSLARRRISRMRGFLQGDG